MQALAPSIQIFGNVLHETEVDDHPLPAMSHPSDSTPEMEPTPQLSPVLHHNSFQDLFSLGEPQPWVEFNQYFPILSNIDPSPNMTDYMEEILWKAKLRAEEFPCT
jgi:hypothetical protein